MTAFWGTNCTLPLPPLFLAKALDGASLPTLGAAQLVECGVRVEHACSRAGSFLGDALRELCGVNTRDGSTMTTV